MMKKVNSTNNQLSYFKAFVWIQLIGIVNFIGAYFFYDFYNYPIGRASVNSIALGIPIYFLGKSIKEDELFLGSNSKLSILEGILLGISLFCIYELIYCMDYFIHTGEMNLNIIIRRDNWLTSKLKYNFLSILIVSPILEEVLFRGVLINRLSKRYKSWKVFIFISFIFTLSHLENHLDFGFYTGIFFLSITLCIYYAKSRSLIGTILFHFSYNACFYLYGYLNSQLLDDSFYIILFTIMILFSYIGIWVIFKKWR